MINVCALGELLIDFTPVVSDNPFPCFNALPGGAPCNFLAACSAVGCSSSFIGKVGNDDFGRLLERTIKDKGINTSGLILDDRYFTTLAFVSLDENGERSFSFSRKPGADTMLTSADINFGLIDDCDIFHFGTLSFTDEPSKSATVDALQYAKRKNKKISFDPNYRSLLWKNEKDAVNAAVTGFKFADYVKISEEEAAFYFGCSIEECADILIKKYNCSVVAVTLGARGCYVFNENSKIHVPGIVNPNTVDTTGAGDIWFGYFISELMKSRDTFNQNEILYKAALTANIAASISTTKHGGITSVPTTDEVKAAMKQN